MKHASEFLKLVEEVMPRIREIGPEETYAWMRETPQRGHFILIDVREESEWAAGRIPGAVHMARGVIERDIERAVPDKSTPLVLYCGGGYRSALAADSLQKMGYVQVLSMAGGWREWCAKGLARET